MKKAVTYKSSGVDIDKANVFVDAIKGLTKKTHGQGVIHRPGSFGALFGLDKNAYKKPVLVSSTDGVGTKLLIANTVGKHDTVGIDLVAMNVNDILCVGAKPLFFLDYIACGRLDPKLLKDVMKGISKGCVQAGCSLIGGETAEMPDMYRGDDYDLAGFAVGVVDEHKLIDGSRIKAGDAVIGLPSSGIHSNGYSLVRKVFSHEEQKKLAKELLAPTKIYTNEVMAVLEQHTVNGIAHITGGAYYEKLTKVLPKGLAFELDKSSWTVPKISSLIQKNGNVPDEDMYRTFNMGIGLAIVVPANQADSVVATLKQMRARPVVIGQVVRNSGARLVWKD